MALTPEIYRLVLLGSRVKFDGYRHRSNVWNKRSRMSKNWALDSHSHWSERWLWKQSSICLGPRHTGD